MRNKLRERHFPDWLENSAGAIYGGWEPLMYLRRDRGEGDWESDFQRQHSDEAIRAMADGGVDIFITHYHKGHGWQIIQDEIKDIKRQVRTMKKAGIIPGVYFRVDNIFGETFFLEMPEARNWLVVDSEGRNPNILNRPFRMRVCRNVPGYREYVRKVLLYAINEIGVKLFSLDGFHGSAETEECRCEHCRSRFRAFLKKRWQCRPEEAARYFGFSELSGIEIPPPAGGNRNAGSAAFITEPVYQEYIRFRCEDWAEWHRYVMNTVLGASQDVVVSLNCGIVSWQNTVAQNGVYLPRLDTRNTMVFIEDGHFAWVREGGVISHRIRDYKIASVLGLRCIAYCHDYNVPYLKRAVSESLAFNNGVVGHISHCTDVDSVLGDSPASRTRRAITDWRRKNSRLWRRVESASEVGVLRSFESMAFDCCHPWRHTMLVEETLIRNQIPFDPVFDEQLDDRLGSQIKVLILAGQSCLTDAAIGKIADFVRKGGKLLVTGNSGGRTPWATRRQENGLIRALKLSIPSGSAPVFPSTRESAPQARFETLFSDRPADTVSLCWPARPANFIKVLGQGRMAYIPEIIPAVKEELWHPAWRINPEHGYYDITGNVSDPKLHTYREYPFVNWRLPVNAGQVVDAIRWLHPDAPFIIDAPDTTVVNWLKRTDAAEEMLHFLNYANDGVVAGASLFVQGHRYGRAVFNVMDPRARRIDLTPGIRSGRIRLPEFLTYGVLSLYG